MDKIKKLFIYYLYKLRKSIISFLFLIGYILISIIVPLICYFVNERTLYYSSFIIAIVFQVYTLFSTIFYTIKLFSEEKNNLSDLKLLGKNYYRMQLFFVKFTIISLILLIGNIMITLTTSIVFAILNVDKNIILATVISNSIGLLINSLFFLPLVIIICSAVKKIWVPFISMLLLLFPLSSIASNLLLTNSSKNNNLDINVNNKDALITYNKIYKYDENNACVESTNVYSINYTSMNNDINSNLDFDNNINFINNWSSLLPGNITMSTQQGIYSLIVRNNPEILKGYNKYRTSLVKFTSTNHKNVSSFLEPGKNYILSNVIDDNILDLPTDKFNKHVINKLNELRQNRYFNEIMNNETLINGMSRQLYSNPIWSLKNFSYNQLNFLYELLGKTHNVFFYLWFNNDILDGNIGNLYSNIQNNFGTVLSNFVQKLWTSYDTYLNIIVLNSSDELISFRKILDKKYPINYTYNTDLFASKRDINFFKNALINIKDNRIYFLSNNSTYLELDKTDFYKYFPNNINTQEDWVNYISKTDNLTTGFLEKIYKNLSSCSSNLIEYRFNNDNFSLNTFNSTFEISITSFINLWPLWMFSQILGAFILFILSVHVYRKCRLS